MKKKLYYTLRNRQEGKITYNLPNTNCVTFGDRSFAVNGPKMWNELPKELQEINSLTDFKKRLKTYLFLKAF